MNRFLIACGGTGGHLAPGIALAEALISRGHWVQLVISEKKVDQRLVEKYPNMEFCSTPGTPFSFNPIKLAVFGWQQIRSWWFCRSLIRRTEAEIVIGFGGFSCVGIAVASLTERIPLALHESNRMPGRMVRMFHNLARRIYLPPGVRIRGLSPEVARYFGNPVRKEFQKIPHHKARQRLGLDPNRKTLVILGGSQGAQSLNRWVKEKFDNLALEGIQVYCITGLSSSAQSVVTFQTRDGQEIKAVFVNFSDRMPDVLSSADLVVSRAGAGTIAELVRCGVPSILIPYPFAADDHQRANAHYVEQQGGGLVVEQDYLGDLHKEVLDTIFNDWLLQKLRANLERMDRTNVLDLMTRDLETLAQEETKNRRLRTLEEVN